MSTSRRSQGSSICRQPYGRGLSGARFHHKPAFRRRGAWRLTCRHVSRVVYADFVKHGAVGLTDVRNIGIAFPDAWVHGAHACKRVGQVLPSGHCQLRQKKFQARSKSLSRNEPTLRANSSDVAGDSPMFCIIQVVIVSSRICRRTG